MDHALERKRVSTRAELIDLLFELLDHNDAVEWDNETSYAFLQALAAWLQDADGFYRNIGEQAEPEEASWQLFADALQAATTYE